MVVPENVDRAALQAALPPSVRLPSAEPAADALTQEAPMSAGTLMYLPLRRGAPALPRHHRELFDQRALLFLRQLQVVRVHDWRGGAHRSTVFACEPRLQMSPAAASHGAPAAPAPGGSSPNAVRDGIGVPGAPLGLQRSGAAGETEGDLPGGLGRWRLHTRQITCQSAVAQVRRLRVSPDRPTEREGMAWHGRHGKSRSLG